MAKRAPINNVRLARKRSAATDTLRLATAFVGADLTRSDQLTEWVDVIWRRFVVAGGGGDIVGPMPTRTRRGAPFGAAELRQMQDDARALFTGVTTLRNGEESDTPSITIHSLTVSVVELLPGRPVLFVDGDSRDVFRLALLRALEHGALENVLQCKDKKCCAFFFKMGKKEFCSTRCQQRVQMRARRANERRRSDSSLALVRTELKDGKSTRPR
jgi:hypothetical protein